ncbi:MAG: carbonic anhydrase family protein [Actinomycetia bacterium]|nr:carbonic anhydrase family protein [Actinomycetes bacterium]
MKRLPFVSALLGAALVLSACSFSPGSAKTTSTTPTVAVPATSTTSVASSTAPSWSYTGDTGPAHWGDLDPAWSAAKDGKKQSPVDIVTAQAQAGTGHPASLSFAAVAFGVENNGHTVEIVPESKEATITLDGATYVFQQAHFHAPSEHTVNGTSYPVEMHLVNQDAQGHIAVLGVFLTEGATNTALDEVFAHMPAAVTTTATEYKTSPIDLTAVVPSGPVYRYEGSLTTPPCTEGVQWSVYATPIEASAAQIAAFTAIYSANARPVQPLNDRTVQVV